MEPDDSRLRYELNRSVTRLTGTLGWFVSLVLVLVFYLLATAATEPPQQPDAAPDDSADVKSLVVTNLPTQGSVTIGGATLHGNPANGFALYKRNCKSCHSVDGTRGVGPSLLGVTGRWDSAAKIKTWIKNPAEYLRTGDAYTNGLLKEYNTTMSSFGNLKEEEVNDILVFVGMQQ